MPLSSFRPRQLSRRDCFSCGEASGLARINRLVPGRQPSFAGQHPNSFFVSPQTRSGKSTFFLTLPHTGMVSTVIRSVGIVRQNRTAICCIGFYNTALPKFYTYSRSTPRN